MQKKSMLVPRFSLLIWLSLFTLIGLVACSTNSDESDGSNDADPNAITDINWQWTSVTERSSGNETTVPDPSIYTIVFHTDGSVTGQADCNNFSGTYSQDNGLVITLGPSTMAFCGEASLDQVYVGLLGSIVAGGPDGSGGLALETAGGAERMSFQNGGAAP
ncbi:MAG: META domain-containing protein [Anaerolineae bacterium]|nr:META domain-containing protein [Anaerolineae bacterium]